jgi:hypothetical protein
MCLGKTQGSEKAFVKRKAAGFPGAFVNHRWFFFGITGSTGNAARVSLSV